MLDLKTSQCKLSRKVPTVSLAQDSRNKGTKKKKKKEAILNPLTAKDELSHHGNFLIVLDLKST